KIMNIPQYLVFSGIGIIDTFWVLILPALGMTLGVFLLKQFMEGVPDAIIESGRIDGANEFAICWRIVIPSVKPAVITLLIFVFQNIWNNTGSNMIYTESIKVLPTVLLQIGASGIARAGTSAAASLLLMIPSVLIFIIAQSKVIETMSSSGIKE
ncbi:MAG: carbohydrate ABC transporter permease, partial [Saccharofermentanales bacterium]